MLRKWNNLHVLIILVLKTETFNFWKICIFLLMVLVLITVMTPGL